MADQVNNFGAFASDPVNDPYGPVGSETRKNRTRGDYRITWPARGMTETADNARSETARAKSERGEGRDIKLPSDTPRDDVSHDPNDPRQMTDRDRKYAIDRDWRERDSPAAQRRATRRTNKTRKLSSRPSDRKTGR